MTALAPKDFEKKLRQLCDSFFERSDLPQLPFARLNTGTLDLEELRAFFRSENRWETSLFFNQYILTALLEKCPDDAGRAKLWTVIEPEYGNGIPASAHTSLARRFYLALGFTEAELPLSLEPGPALDAQIDRLQKESFVETLAGRFLGPETVGPKVFRAYAHGLAKIGLSKESVSFYILHGVEDENDSSILFELVANYARTESEQQAAINALKRYYDLPRIRAFCAIRPLAYSFTEKCRLAT